MSKFDDFTTALRKLCEQHGVSVAPTESGEIGVWDLAPGDAPLSDLVDCTLATTEPKFGNPPPAIFATGIEAAAHPGFVAQELSERLANNVRTLHPGSIVVPIGSSSRIRAWAVIKPS